MSLSDAMLDALNVQLRDEIYSAYLYLSIASYFDAQNLTGFSHWNKVQWEEELFHARKFYNFINDRGGRVRLLPIDGPKTDWSSPLEAMQDALEHERHMSRAIDRLVDMAVKESDHAAQTFLQWFVTEQVEEEATVSEIVDKLNLVGGNGTGVFFLDRELAARPAAADPEQQPA